MHTFNDYFIAHSEKKGGENTKSYYCLLVPHTKKKKEKKRLPSKEYNIEREIKE